MTSLSMLFGKDNKFSSIASNLCNSTCIPEISLSEVSNLYPSEDHNKEQEKLRTNRNHENDQNK